MNDNILTNLEFFIDFFEIEDVNYIIDTNKNRHLEGTKLNSMIPLFVNNDLVMI